MITLGSKVRDTVSGFTGIVVARHTFLTGCERYSVQPAVGKDGKLPDIQAFDEVMLDVVKPAKPMPPVTTGGPQPDVKPKHCPGQADVRRAGR